MGRYLITGATSGLGLSVLHALRECGHAVHAIGRGVDRLHGLLGTSWCHEATLGAYMLFPESLSAAGPLDGIVHCAGQEVIGPLRLARPSHWEDGTMAAGAAFRLLSIAAQRGTMVDGGSIVMMSSVAAHRGTAGLAAYSAGKAAIEAMVRCAAVELAPRRIRVNAVAAGAFRSPMHDRITRRMGSQAAADAYAAAHPLGIGDCAAVRDAILHLLGDGASWTTGTVHVVDGGLLSRG